jgi:nitrite reductase/ring-hydroxylating ferredoxin subunit
MDEDRARAEQQAAEDLEAYVAALLADRAPDLPPGLGRAEIMARVLAGELAGERPGADRLPADVRARLEARLDEAGVSPLPDVREPLHLTRRRGLTALAGMAAGVLVGVALDRELPGLGHPGLPSLVGPNGRWYDVADAAGVPPGAARRFSSGGVDGYLLNEGGRVYALSAICTHMGCHIDWHAAHERFGCLCHGAAFSRHGHVVAGIPPARLPAIAVRVHRGRIYAWGTQAATWG